MHSLGASVAVRSYKPPPPFPNELDRFLDNEFATMGSIIGTKSICSAADEAEFANFEYQSNGHALNE